MIRLTRLGRLRVAVDAVVAVAADPPTEVWLPVKDSGSKVPGRYPSPGGRIVLVLYDPDVPAATEVTA